MKIRDGLHADCNLFTLFTQRMQSIKELVKNTSSSM